MPKSLILTFHYLDANNGGSNASKGFIWSYAFLNADTSLIYPEHDNFDSSAFIPESVKKYPVYDHRSKIQKGLDIYRGRMHRFTDFVKDHLSKEKYDIIFLDHSISTAGVIRTAKETGAKIICIHHNVEADYIKDNQPSILYKLPFNYFSKKAERDALIMSDVNLTLTKEMADVFQSWYPNRNLHLHTIGICEYKAHTNFYLREVNPNNTFIISGSLCFKQSEGSILEFIQRFYPIMQSTCSESKLIVTGRNPSAEIVKACKSHGIELIPNPDNMDDVVRQASVYISPINAGSGIKLRVMDGLKRGMPVICHKVSSVGYETFERSGVLFAYDNEDSFKKALLQVVSKQFNANEIYSLYQRQFSFMSGVNRLRTILSLERLI